MSKASDWSRADLAQRPTLHQGHHADLKVETPTERVWLSRLLPADGGLVNGIFVSHKREDGTWE